jgi:sugar phosphate isomerase/epimerase
MNRRRFVQQVSAGLVGSTLATVAAPAQAAGAASPPVRVGMTDWNLGKRGDVSKVALAREIGLDGIQVSLIFPEDGSPHLRGHAVQEEYRRAALEQGIQICSLAIGSPGKARLPLHTNPAAAVLLVEAVEAARAIGTTDILLPVLGDSHIHVENAGEVDTFVAMMKEVARFAEKAGVVVSLETWISADDTNRILDRIGSDYVGVYYDARNIKSRKAGEPMDEVAKLGKRIHQVHVKNGQKLLGEPEILDWPRLAAEYEKIGYRGWYVLETGAPSGDLVRDTRHNLEYVRKTFRMPAQA